MAKLRKPSRWEDALEHARRTTGTIQWCQTGPYSGDGKRRLAETHIQIQAIQKFIKANCRKFSAMEIVSVLRRKKRQENRLQKLAKLAIDIGKYDSAKRLCELARDTRDDYRDIKSSDMVFWRIL